METTVIPVEASRKASEIELMAKKYDNYAITTADTYSDAGTQLKAIKAKAKELDDLRKSLTQPLDESKKRIMDFFKKPLDFLTKAESAVKSAMLNWQQEQERIRREEERRLEEERRKEEARQQAIKDEEERRLRAKEEAARKESARLAAAGKAKEAAEAAARAAKAAQEAQAKAAEQIFTPEIEVQTQKVEKIVAINTAVIWKYRIVDANKIPREYLIPNEIMLGQVARSTKGALQVAGIEFYSEQTIRAGR